MRKTLLAVLLLLMMTQSIMAETLDKEGKYFVTWGYNRATHSNSDIHLKGNGYNYTLTDVEASDRPSEFGEEYFTSLTIPQWNLRVGYFLDGTQSIVVGIDHMKYVVDRPQIAKIDGVDHLGVSHDNDMIELDGFLAFEHTDGLNYWSVAYNYNQYLWENESGDMALSGFVGVGGGVLIPRSNVTLEGYADRNDEFKIAGYGMDVQAGLTFDFAENFFVRAEVKSGYIDMTSVATSSSNLDRATHDFTFLETVISFGYLF